MYWEGGRTWRFDCILLSLKFVSSLQKQMYFRSLLEKRRPERREEKTGKTSAFVELIIIC